MTFRRVGRSDPARLLGGKAPEGAVGKVLCEAPKSHLMPAKKGHSKSRYSSRPTVEPVLNLIKTGSHQPGVNLRGLGAFSRFLYHKIGCCRSKSEGTRGTVCGVCPEKLRKKIDFFHIAIPKKPLDPSVTRSDFWSFWHFGPPRVP